MPRKFGSDRTVHRWFILWARAGIFHRVWSELVAECDALGQVDWRWQAVDGGLGKARMGGDAVGENPADRAKPGTKKSLAVDAQGGPLGIVVAPANFHDSKLLKATLESIVVPRPRPTAQRPQHLALDKAYDTLTRSSSSPLRATSAIPRASSEASGYPPLRRTSGDGPKRGRPWRRRRKKGAAEGDSPLGRRAHSVVALEVPQSAHPLQQAGPLLPRTRAVRLRSPLVQETAPDKS